MILWKKGSKSLSAVDTFQSLLFLFPSMASGNFITEIEEKMTEYYKKMRRTSTFVRLDWLIFTDLYYNNDISQSTYWSDNEVEVIRI